VVVVILSLAGVGGFLILNRAKGKPNNVATTGTESRSSAAASTPSEISRYWLELEKPSTKVAGLVPIASGQSLKLHFVFTESGYLYLIGLGRNNQPTAFLTAKPPEGSGLKNNRAAQSVDFSFPGDDNWLTLDSKPGTENYTVIFSKVPLTTPSFFNAPANMEALSQAEQSELKEFTSKYQGTGQTTELDNSNSAAPFVRVKALPGQIDNPIVFDIRIQHK